MKIYTDVPTLEPYEVFRQYPNGSSVRPDQRVKLPDKHRRFTLDDHPAVLVRYRVQVDTSYLNQSNIVAEFWNPTRGWTKVLTLDAEYEFYIVSGPPKDAANPAKRELYRPHRFNEGTSEKVAESWQKIYNLLDAETGSLLRALSQ